MPYAPITLKGLKPKDTDFEPRSLGEHVRKRRLELRLSQKEVARRLGWSWRSVFNWENGKTNPAIESIPGIIGFLGYGPFPEPGSLSDQLIAVRRANGWTIKQAAAQLGVDEGTWARWEKTGIPWKRHQAVVKAFLEELSCPEADQGAKRFPTR